MSAPPDWLDPLFEAQEMRDVDAWAIETQGVPSPDLMERAGEGLARITAAAARPGPVRVVVGKGNNGGDGLVVARLLRAEGREVDVLAVADMGELEGDARANLDRLPGEPPEDFSAEALEGSGAVVDAMLGTGFSGEPREPIASAIAAINAQDAPVVACDVPSGVDAGSGRVEGQAVRATATGTFHGPKVGLYVAPGALHAGRVEVIAIGVPRGAPAPERAGLIADAVLGLYPHRGRDGSKFTSGVVVVAGGGEGLTGAPTMTALAAQRAGAGYVQVAVPEAARTTLELRLLEAMTRGLPDREGGHTEEGVDALAQMAERAGAVVLGPGLGRTDGAVAFARGVAQAVEAPLLIDADGLNAHAGALDSLSGRPGPTVLTPHEAELGRLLEREPDDIAADRLAAVREAAATSGAVTLLKGDDTIVARPDGLVAVSRGGTPALATAGTGDVLSGLIGALLAKGVEPFAAAALGTLAHANAGRGGRGAPRRRPRGGRRRDRGAACFAPGFSCAATGCSIRSRAMASTVGEIMDGDPETVTADTPVEEVIRIMRTNELPGIPVVNEGGRCVGIVTETDMVLPDDDGDLHLPHYVNIFGGTVFLEPLRKWEDRLKKAFASTAKDMMSENPTTVEPSTTIDEAAGIIHDTGHNRLPVVEHGRLVGVVTRVDVLGGLVSD